MVDEIQATGANYWPDRIAPIRSAAGHNEPISRSDVNGDQVEISELAYWRAKVAELPGVREEQVAAVRRQIANGTYETAGKWDIALDRLLQDIGSSET